jgi:uncharacterized protein YeaO (DUF488 family)
LAKTFSKNRMIRGEPGKFPARRTGRFSVHQGIQIPCSAEYLAPRCAAKLAYEPAPEDGILILVDRLWPRGLSKEKAAVEHWMKDIAPSTDLRKWFGHDPERWPEFRRRYRGSLSGMARSSLRLAISPPAAQSRSSMRPTKKSTTTPSCCGRFW